MTPVERTPGGARPDMMDEASSGPLPDSLGGGAAVAAPRMV